jgi:hypothetical protein
MNMHMPLNVLSSLMSFFLKSGINPLFQVIEESFVEKHRVPYNYMLFPVYTVHVCLTIENDAVMTHYSHAISSAWANQAKMLKCASLPLPTCTDGGNHLAE